MHKLSSNLVRRLRCYRGKKHAGWLTAPGLVYRQRDLGYGGLLISMYECIRVPGAWLVSHFQPLCTGASWRPVEQVTRRRVLGGVAAAHHCGKACAQLQGLHGSDQQEGQHLLHGADF